jgi:hypothetical protein
MLIFWYGAGERELSFLCFFNSIFEHLCCICSLVCICCNVSISGHLALDSAH